MTTRKELEAYLTQQLNPGWFADYCPNGLQVEGQEQIRTLMSGVTASQELIAHAVDAGADTLLVHHGYFWRSEDLRVVGMKAQRLRRLLHAQINLFAYHLPLDAHEVWGNNVQLATQLGLVVDGLLVDGDLSAGRVGRVSAPESAPQLARRFEDILDHPIVWAGPESEEPIQTVGWCTGAGQRFIEQAAELGLDAFISGEISEPTAHVARECGIHYFACGHHATERYGVAALGQHLADHFGLEYTFVDIPNPA